MRSLVQRPNVPTQTQCVCVCKRVFNSETCVSMPRQPHTNTACAPPQLFLWGSGSDSCPSGPHRARTVLKKTRSAHCSEVSRPTSRSQRGTVTQAKQKALKAANSGTASHNERGNNTHRALKKRKKTHPAITIGLKDTGREDAFLKSNGNSRAMLSLSRNQPNSLLQWEVRNRCTLYCT